MPTPNRLRFLITAGPTREWLDPVRFLSNPSSGKMGYALAQAAREAGADVTLISGPVALAAPRGVTRVCVETAAEMAREVFRRAKSAEIIILSAAVADWAPLSRARQKMKKEVGGRRRAKLVLTLKPTVDIAATVGQSLRPGQVLAGFAAETQHVLANARGKMERKNFDMIVANDVSRPGTGFGSDHNEILLIHRDGTLERPRRATKRTLARRIVQRVCALRARKLERS